MSEPTEPAIEQRLADLERAGAQHTAAFSRLETELGRQREAFAEMLRNFSAHAVLAVKDAKDRNRL